MAKNIIRRLVSLSPFIFACLLIISILLMAIGAIFSYYDYNILLAILNNPYEKYIIKFNLYQAFLATIITIALAIPITRTLHKRREFFGRGMIMHLLNVSFALPAIALVLGIIIIHGKNGWINQLMLVIFGSSFDHYLYGLFGTILGHLAFCVPIATRLLLGNLDAVPQETWRLSSQLNFSQFNIFKLIEWPAMRHSVLSVSFLVFMLCFTSFIIVLSLGGGPAVSSLEISIYHAIKIDSDLHKAAALSLIQLSICASFLLIAYKLNLGGISFAKAPTKQYQRLDTNGVFNFFLDALFIGLLALISLLPIIGILFHGFNEQLLTLLYSDKFIYSLKQSLIIAISSAILTVALALSLVSGAFYLHYHLNKPWLTKWALLLCNARGIISAFVLITGFFIILSDVTYVMNHAFCFLIIMSAVASLPFVTNILWSSSLCISANEINLCRNLNIDYINFIRLIYYPKIRQNFGYALAFSMAISWGDLSLIALFSSQDISTISYMLYNALNHYNLEEAITLSLVMFLMSFFFFWILDEFYRKEQQC